MCVVTGATAGIGRATAAELARRGATVVLVGRSREKLDRAVAGIGRAAGAGGAHGVLADLAVQAEVRAAAEGILARWPAVHVLVNNAGVFIRRRQVTPDGVEVQLAVNHLAPFLLTRLLLDGLRAGAPARVLAVSSGMHRYAAVRWDDPGMREGYNGLRQYSNTKLFNLLFTNELARRLPPGEVTANALHPGLVGTALLFEGWAPLRLLKPFIRKPEQGARTAVHLAASPEVAGVTGGFFIDERPARPAPAALDPAAALRLWQISEELTGLR